MAWFRAPGNPGGSLKVKTASGNIASFETNLVAPLHSVLVDVVASGGNGTPDNPNPIVGYSSANITRCGVNLGELTETNKHDQQGSSTVYENHGVNITASAAYARTSYEFKIKKGVQYTISFYGSGTGNFINVYFNDEITWGAQSYGRILLSSTRTKYTKTIIATSDDLFVGFYVTTSGTTGDMVIEDFMLEVGSSASNEYHPYNGQTYTVNLGQTVYGGQLDVTRGKLHVTYEENEISTVVQTGTSSGGVNYAQCGIVDNNRIKSNGDIMCPIYTKTTSASDNNAIRLVDKTIYIYDNRFTDLATAQSLAIGTKIIYELATPFDIDLTPEVISAVVGENNVFADCGQTTVKYLKRE